LKKITFLMLHLNYGGLEKQTTTLINELAKTKNYEIEIISVYDIIGKSFYDLDSSVKVKYLLPYGPNKEKIKEFLSSKKYFSLIKQLLKGFKILFLKYFLMSKEIKKLNTDYIFSTRTEFSNLINRKDTINIFQEHCAIDSNLYFKKNLKTFRNIHYVVVMTEKLKEIFENNLSKNNFKCRVLNIPNMIENIEYNDEVKDDGVIKLISIGRLHEVKDFSTLIDVFNIVKSKIDNVELQIIGEGSDRKTIENRIKYYNLEKSVKLLGKCEEDIVSKELKKSDIFVLTSKSESFSLVICEAMQASLPVVAFDVDFGPREIIKDNETGFLIKYKDISEMSEKIIYLIKNNEQRKIMGIKGKQDVKKFYSEELIYKWIEILK
jgi:glycosyltransferase involved in cell wall biosynthesis